MGPSMIQEPGPPRPPVLHDSRDGPFRWDPPGSWCLGGKDLGAINSRGDPSTWTNQTRPHEARGRRGLLGSRRQLGGIFVIQSQHIRRLRGACQPNRVAFAPQAKPPAPGDVTGGEREREKGEAPGVREVKKTGGMACRCGEMLESTWLMCEGICEDVATPLQGGAMRRADAGPAPSMCLLSPSGGR